MHTPLGSLYTIAHHRTSIAGFKGASLQEGDEGEGGGLESGCRGKGEGTNGIEWEGAKRGWQWER